MFPDNAGEYSMHGTQDKQDNMPEDELLRIRQAESEIPQLKAYYAYRIILQIAENLGIDTPQIGVPLRTLQAPRAPRSEWLFAFTSEFSRNLKKIGDRKKQERILLAITRLIKWPTLQQGDTIKPLHGNLKGKWRYRLGVYRLVYFPDKEKGVVYLLLISTSKKVID